MMGNYISLQTAQSIFAAVSRASEIRVDAISSRSRAAELVRARWAVMKLMRDRGASLPVIGWRMHMDHSTILHGLRRFECDPYAQALVAKVKAQS